MKILIWIGALFAVGCADSMTVITGPNGQPAAMITCGRSMYLKPACYNNAAAACPHGYNIIDTQGTTGTFAYVNHGTGYAVPVYRGSLMIQCKPIEVIQ